MAAPSLVPPVNTAALGTVFVLRHGWSLANEAGIVVSSLANGVLPAYRLAPEGVRQAAAAGQQLLALLALEALPASAVQVVASPFSRTIDTAETAAAQLGLPAGAVRQDAALRERFFGDAHELQPHRRAQRRKNLCSVPCADAAPL